MKWSIVDILSVIMSAISILTTLVSVFVASNAFMRKFGQVTNEVKNLGMRVDKLERKVDEILYFLSRKFKKHNWKR